MPSVCSVNSLSVCQISTEEDFTILGRPKVSGSVECAFGLPFPVPVSEDGDAPKPLIRAKLVSSARAVVTETSHIELLRKRLTFFLQSTFLFQRLILCRVSLPPLDDYRTNPWDAIRKATVVETLIDHWNTNYK
ncbi:hypothetical protein AHF37_04549 [Paragonimus kellicotti]|nr:hypothetical protein AHF37_04549 [Paragonimus kellicotti]